MIIALLVILGLCFGSFANATVWRIREQSKPRKKRAASDKELSIMTGRSMCVHCKHVLGPADLVPLFSWLWLRGKCRYCKQAIDDPPIVELILPIVFVASYVYWPYEFTTAGWARFAVWLLALIGFAALIVYDARWMLLPNRIVYPMIGLAGANALLYVATARTPLEALEQVVLTLLITSGIFYILFKLSNGTWIGGGDVKLGIVLGGLLLKPDLALLMLFTSSLLGTLYALPQMARQRLRAQSKLPYGPFLIIATVAVMLFGTNAVAWYTRVVMGI